MKQVESALIAHCAKAVAKHLLMHGRTVGPFMPWHFSKDPYVWLIAEVLLRRTARTTARRAFEALVGSYPTWETLASATDRDIAARIAWVGLGNQRTRQLRAMAQAVVGELKDVDLCQRDTLLGLPGVGTYIADAVLLHACDKRTFPLDGSVQRILRRVMGLPMAQGAMRLNPYRDPWVRGAADRIMSQHTAAELRDIHRGALHMAWQTCRPSPKCFGCPLMKICRYASGISPAITEPSAAREAHS